MCEEIVMQKINPSTTVKAVSDILQRIDPRLIDHGERVAYIACEMARHGNLDIDEKELYILCLFHDIGAYKTDEIDRMVEFETTNVKNHSIYGYLFLKNMTPIGDNALPILYHHNSYQQLCLSVSPKTAALAGLIHIADRADIFYLNRTNTGIYDSILMNKNQLFKQEYVDLFVSALRDRDIFSKLQDGSYRKSNKERIDHYDLSPELALAFLKMMVYSIDFRSEFTVTHTINTVSISVNIAEHFKLSDEDIADVYLGALLHDVGKVAIPISILENPGRLTADEMEIMKEHAKYTEIILKDIVPDYILNISARHHEKLDGSGYPHNITGDKLNFKERIVAVADIVSALANRRSYKDPFSKGKSISILESMKGTQLDSDICDYVCTCYDDIISETDISRNKVIQHYQNMLREYERLSV